MCELVTCMLRETQFGCFIFFFFFYIFLFHSQCCCVVPNYELTQFLAEHTIFLFSVKEDEERKRQMFRIRRTMMKTIFVVCGEQSDKQITFFGWSFSRHAFFYRWVNLQVLFASRSCKRARAMAKRRSEVATCTFLVSLFYTHSIRMVFYSHAFSGAHIHS